VVLVALAGCAIGATLRSYDVAPNGLERSEERLRLALTRARGDSGVRPKDDDLPGDALVKSLYQGSFAYYSGRYAEAADLFDRADQLAEARYTKSISQNALAMMTNDRELDYEPGINERLLMHYYAALAYWRKGDGEGATVEARKLAYLLQKFEADTTSRDKTLRQTLRTFAGVLFEAAGERNDALVSYRNAQAIAGGRVNADSLETLPSDALTADSGDVVIVVEQGFVAFPTPWDLTVPIYKHEWNYVSGEDRFRGGWMSARIGNRLSAQLGGDGGLWWTGPSATLGFDDRWAGMTAGSASDVNLTYRPGNQYAYRYDPRWGWAPVRVFATPERILKLSVPIFKRPRALGAPSIADAPGTVSVIAAADLSEAEVADFDRVRTWTYARAVLRVAVKAIAAEEAEKAVKRSTKDEKKGDRLGQLFGFLTSAAGAVLERADTRNWNLLPQAVTLVRVRVPVSAHDVRLAIPGGTVLLPLPRIRPRGVTLATARIWSGPAEW
jgi:hypothetical protein